MKLEYEVPNEIGKMFAELDTQTYGIISRGLYDGADEMADAIRAATPKDSGELADSLFIANFERGYNSVDTVIGFAGYDSKGMPNPLKAAVLESGDSRGRKATHFFSKAVRNAKRKAEGEIERTIDIQIKKITGGK